MIKERELLARAGLIIAQYRWSDPEDNGLRELSEQINAYFEEPEVKEQDQSIDLSASAAYLEDLAPQWRKRNPDNVTDVLRGIRFAERHYGIREEK